MTCYVDNAQIPYGRMKMCHLLAGTREDLEEMARKIGLPTSATIQNPGQPNEHIDVSMTYRAKAVQHGAVEVDSRGLVKLIRAKRAKAAEVTSIFDFEFEGEDFAELPSEDEMAAFDKAIEGAEVDPVGGSNPDRWDADGKDLWSSGHSSDCAKHDAPAYEAGICTCGFEADPEPSK